MQNLTNADYHAHSAIGASGLRLLNQSPKKYWSAYRDPEREHIKPTDAMLRGTMIHTACLEPHLFDNQFAVLPDGIDKRTKDGKNLIAEIESSGKTPIKSDDFKLAGTLAGLWNIHPFQRSIQHCNAIIEKSFITELFGVAVKIRPDLFIEPCSEFPNGLIVDYKTTADASPSGWSKSICNYEYWIQSALYAMVIHDIYKTAELAPFYWFTQETDAPYLNAVYYATPEIQTYGADEVNRLLDVYKKCLARDYWPGYSLEPQAATLPIWKQREITASDGELDITYA